MKTPYLESLYRLGTIKFGKYHLKSGALSPVYFDLRILVSYPILMKNTAGLMKDLIGGADCIVPVPMGAIPLGTVLSQETGIPMLMVRPKGKDHGTKKLIEGNARGRCVVVEDICTTGGSANEVVKILQEDGREVIRIVCLIKNPGASGVVELKSVFEMNDVIKLYQTKKLIGTGDYLRAKNFFDFGGYEEPWTAWKKMSIAKESDIIVSLDIESIDKILYLAQALGPYVCGIKLHLDTISEPWKGREKLLREIASDYGFLIIEDRKFSDIGKIVKKQMKGKEAFCDVITAHAISGPGTLEALREYGVGILLIAQMSSEGNLCGEDYTKKVVGLGKQFRDLVYGFVCQEKLCDDFMSFCPGVKLNEGGDALGQQYRTPQEVRGKGVDFLIVGSGIYESADPVNEIKKYLK